MFIHIHFRDYVLYYFVLRLLIFSKFWKPALEAKTFNILQFNNKILLVFYYLSARYIGR